jgi:hypothetical protein
VEVPRGRRKIQKSSMCDNKVWSMASKRRVLLIECAAHERYPKSRQAFMALEKHIGEHGSHEDFNSRSNPNSSASRVELPGRATLRVRRWSRKIWEPRRSRECW